MKRSAVYQKKMADPLSWLCQSIELMRAAYAVYGCIERNVRRQFRGSGQARFCGDAEYAETITSLFSNAYMLLCGYAIENAVKGLIVIQKPPRRNAQNLPGYLKSHDLAELLKDAGIGPLEEWEEAVVGELQKAVTWAGRYCTPLLAQDLDLTDSFGGANVTFRGPADVKLILEKIVKEYTVPNTSLEGVDIADLMKPVESECPRGPMLVSDESQSWSSEQD